MGTTRRFATADQVGEVAAAVFGSDRRVTSSERLPNGSKKGVYRLELDDRTRAVLYVWDQSEDYWQGVLPQEAADPADAFSHASGLALFEGASRRLEAVGVRTPRLLLADRSRTLYPADIAVVEDVAGGTLEELLERDPDAAAPVLDRLAEALGRMHAHRAPRFGKVAHVDGGGTANGASCAQVVLDQALAEVDQVAAEDPRAAAARESLVGKLHSLAARITAESRPGIIHGELGPDHVLVAADGTPVLIDIEGLMYFDIEWEHVFLRLRFGARYERLRRADLDTARLQLYQLAQHLDLVAGPLAIARTDHPERVWFLELAEHHLQRALEFVG